MSVYQEIEAIYDALGSKPRWNAERVQGDVGDCILEMRVWDGRITNIFVRIRFDIRSGLEMYSIRTDDIRSNFADRVDRVLDELGSDHEDLRRIADAVKTGGGGA